MNTVIKLYGNSASPFVRHCQLALIEGEIDYEFIKVDAKLSAQLSPMQKIPFIEYADAGRLKMLTDSTSILRFAREKPGQKFLPTIEDLDKYCSVNTLIDAQLNLFLLKKEGLDANKVMYLQRQENRIKTGLEVFESMTYSDQAPWSDAELRLVCFLDWVRFRKHFSLEAYPVLYDFLKCLDKYPPFLATALADF